MLPSDMQWAATSSTRSTHKYRTNKHAESHSMLHHCVAATAPQCLYNCCDPRAYLDAM